MGVPPQPQIFLRPVGSPLTLGMSGLAVASLVQSGLDLRWIPASQGQNVSLILISVPFVAQLVACVFAYLARDGATGAAVGILSVSWLAQGLVHLVSGSGARSGALGLMLLAVAAMLIAASAAVALGRPLPGLVFALAGLRFIASALFELGGGVGWRDAAGIVGLVVLALAAYCGLAFELEGQQHQAILPTFRRGSARLDLDPNQAAGAVTLPTEPGVHQTS